MHAKEYKYYMFCRILISYYSPQKMHSFYFEKLFIIKKLKKPTSCVIYIYMDFIIINHPDYKDWNQITLALGSSHALGACLSMAFSTTLPVLQGSVHRRIQARIGYNKKLPKHHWLEKREDIPCPLRI